MAVTEKQMCLACETRPAVNPDAVVPMCSVCMAKASNPRGVTFDVPKTKEASA